MTTPERHAEAILRAAGSSLANYTMPGTRQAILDAVREAMGSGWQPIETAPRDGTPFLASIWVRVNDCAPGWRIYVVGYDAEFDEMNSDYESGWDLEDYAFWQPLPLPPSDGGGDDGK